MVKIVKIPKRKRLSTKNCRSKIDYYERIAINRITAEEKSEAYREAIAANVPVTYVSNGIIYRELNGKKEKVGTVESAE